MAANITFTIIKPGAVKNGYLGNILAEIIRDGFKIKAMKYLKLNQDQARAFYAVHKGKPFYESLVEFMISGPIVVAMLEKENAVESFRALIGATDPSKAKEGTIRKKYGESLQANAIHGSDCDENAVIENNFFFSQCERF